MEEYTTLEVSERLKNEGFNLVFEKVYTVIPYSEMLPYELVSKNNIALAGQPFYPAYTMGELWETLPKTIVGTNLAYGTNVFLLTMNDGIVGYRWKDKALVNLANKNICDAMAKMLLWAKENYPDTTVKYLFN